MKRLLFIVVALLLSSCSSSENHVSGLAMNPALKFAKDNGNKMESQEEQKAIGNQTYIGSKLPEVGAYLCTSDRAITAGFRRDPISGKVTEASEIAKQENITTWRIKFYGGKAQVIVFTGATQTLEEPEEFFIYRKPVGMLLTGTWQQGASLSVQTITIDCSNSSFVYSGQDLSPFMNKTNNFVGSCRPYI